MAVKRVIKGVHVVPMGFANAFLIEGDDGLTLIDAGYRVIATDPAPNAELTLREPRISSSETQSATRKLGT